MISGEEVGHWTDKQTERQIDNQTIKQTNKTNFTLITADDRSLSRS